MQSSVTSVIVHRWQDASLSDMFPTRLVSLS
jgi:hypothetical protein